MPLHMQTVLDRSQIPLKRYFEQIALTLEMAGAQDEITELRLYYAPNLCITWHKHDGALVDDNSAP